MTARLADRITPTAHASTAVLPWPAAPWAAIPALAAAVTALADAADAGTRAHTGAMSRAGDALANAADAMRDAAAADHLANANAALERARCTDAVDTWTAAAFDAADALALAAGALRPTGGGAIASAADRARAWHTIPAAHAAAHLADAGAAMLAGMTRAALEGDT